MEQRIHTIDALKGIGIMGIVLVHIGGGVKLPGILGRIGNNGAKAVQLFFILSAYLALLSFEHYLVRTDGSYSNQKIKKWYGKKLIKLLPFYWIYIFFSLLLNGVQTTYWCGNLSKISIVNILCNIFLLNGWNPWYINTFQITWYLADLMLLYFVTPWIYRNIKSFTQAVKLTCIVVAVSSVVCACMCRLSFLFADAYVWDAYWNIFSFFAESPLLCYGLCLYLGMKENKFWEIKKDTGLYIAVLLLTIVVIYNLINHSEWGILTLSLWGIALLIIIITLMMRPLRIISNNPLFIFLGKYSYGIYLSHWIIYYNFVKTDIIMKINLGSEMASCLLVYCIVLLCSCCISVISTIVLEKTIYFMKDKVRSAEVI